MRTILTAILLLATPFAHATLTWSQTFTIINPALNGAIPDGNPSGIYFDGSFNLANAGDRVLGVSVGLDLSGGYNGDLYAYLAAPDGTLVLLMNQPGTDAFGAGGAGMHITLQAGTSDHGSIQSAGDGYLSGSYNPAGNLTSFGTPGSTGGKCQRDLESVFFGSEQRWRHRAVELLDARRHRGAGTGAAGAGAVCRSAAGGRPPEMGSGAYPGEEQESEHCSALRNGIILSQLANHGWKKCCCSLELPRSKRVPFRMHKLTCKSVEQE